MARLTKDERYIYHDDCDERFLMHNATYETYRIAMLLDDLDAADEEIAKFEMLLDTVESIRFAEASVSQATIDRLTKEIERLRAALPEADKLRILAFYLDRLYPNDETPEVQNDLRRWADLIEGIDA